MHGAGTQADGAEHQRHGSATSLGSQGRQTRHTVQGPGSPIWLSSPASSHPMPVTSTAHRQFSTVGPSVRATPQGQSPCSSPRQHTGVQTSRSPVSVPPHRSGSGQASPGPSSSQGLAGGILQAVQAQPRGQQAALEGQGPAPQGGQQLGESGRSLAELAGGGCCMGRGRRACTRAVSRFVMLGRAVVCSGRLWCGVAWLQGHCSSAAAMHVGKMRCEAAAEAGYRVKVWGSGFWGCQIDRHADCLQRCDQPDTHILLYDGRIC